MLRKLLINFFLFSIFIPLTYGATSCDYDYYGMRCGQGGCSANERCSYKTLEVLGGGITNYIGECTSYNGTPYSCANTEEAVTVDEGCMKNGCGEGYKSVIISSLARVAGFDYRTVVSCPLSNNIGCYPIGDSIGGVQAGLSHLWTCVPDSSCTVANVGCNYNETFGDFCGEGGCALTDYCDKVAHYDTAGNITGYIGQCSGTPLCGGTTVGNCDLPNPSDNPYYCSLQTKCSLGEYCLLDGGITPWGSYNSDCYDISSVSTYPSGCFDTSSDMLCGSAVINPNGTGSIDWPLDWPKSLYCSQGAACMDTTDPSNLDWSFTDDSYPTKGVCVNCTKPGDPCTVGDVQGTSYSDSCCNSNQKCIVAPGEEKGTCQPEPTYSYCASDSSFLTAGSKCHTTVFGDEYNSCDKCPIIKSDGSRSYLHPDGDEYCHPTFNPSSTEFKCDVNAGKCGCAGGATSCNANGSCEICAGLSPEAVCNPSGPSDQCCGSPTISCREVPGGNNEYRCLSEESETCYAIRMGTESCTNETKSCCPSDKPYCSAGTCVADFECSPANEGSCCPGFGTICQSGECVMDTTGECEYEDNVLPPAPGYLGPKIGIITEGQNQGLFSAIGAILYPAGIGIGLFFIVRAGYIIMMSEGSPDEVKRGQEYLTSAVIGTLFIVLSGSILRIIINTLLG